MLLDLWQLLSNLYYRIRVWLVSCLINSLVHTQCIVFLCRDRWSSWPVPLNRLSSIPFVDAASTNEPVFIDWIIRFEVLNLLDLRGKVVEPTRCLLLFYTVTTIDTINLDTEAVLWLVLRYDVLWFFNWIGRKEFILSLDLARLLRLQRRLRCRK